MGNTCAVDPRPTIRQREISHPGPVGQGKLHDGRLDVPSTPETDSRSDSSETERTGQNNLTEKELQDDD